MPKMYLVEWKDAIHLSLNWQESDVYINTASAVADRKHYTCGFLIKETDDYITICLDFAERFKNLELVNMAQIIHKNMIISMTELDIKDANINS